MAFQDPRVAFLDHLTAIRAKAKKVGSCAYSTSHSTAAETIDAVEEALKELTAELIETCTFFGLSRGDDLEHPHYGRRTASKAAPHG